MGRTPRVTRLDGAVGSYLGRVHGIYASRKRMYEFGPRVPHNLVSAGHPTWIGPEKTVEETRERMRKRDEKP